MVEVAAGRPSAPAARQCPNCGRANEGARRLCTFCFGSLAGALEATNTPPAPWWSRIGTPALALVLMVALGVPFYRTYLAGPAAPLAAVSTARSGAAALRGLTRATAQTVDLDGPIAWRQRLPTPVVAPLIADGARAYAATADGRLLALALDDGRVLWSLAVPGQLDHGPVVAGDLLYLSLRDGRVLAIEPATGRTRWSQAVGGWVGVQPLVLEGVVYLGADRRLVALDAERGDLLWTRDLEFPVVASPVGTTNGVAIATTQMLLIYDRSTGQRTYHLNLPFVQWLAVVDGAVFALSSRVLVAVEEDSRRPWWDPLRGVWFNLDLWGFAPPTPPPPTRWVTPNPSEAPLRAGFRATWPMPDPPAVDGGRAYLSWTRGTARALSVVSGEVAWERVIEPSASPPQITVDGLFWVGKHALVLIDPHTGAERARRAFAGAELRGAVLGVGVVVLATDEEIWLLRR